MDISLSFENTLKEKEEERLMYYWSRWANIPVTETIDNEQTLNSRVSWNEPTYEPDPVRASRPVVVFARRNTQPLVASSPSRRAREWERDTEEEGITLDIGRASYAPTRSRVHSSEVAPQAARQVVEPFRLK